MKTGIQGGWKATLILLFVVVFVLDAAAQWQIGEQVLSLPPRGEYFSMRLGTNSPPTPFLPCDVPVYFLGTAPGNTNLAFAYDDRELLSAGRSATQSMESGPPVPGDTNEVPGTSETNSPMETTFDCGTNLYLIIGPTNVVSGPVTDHEAWLVLTNTHRYTYYQLENRPDINPGTPWQFGQLVEDTGTSNQVRFSNVPTYNPSQRFFRGAGGNTIASVGLDPDYNLAVAPASASGSNQIGKFRVSINSSAPSSGLGVAYQISGSASNGVDYTSLSGSITIAGGQFSAELDVTPLFNPLAGLDESVTLTLVLTDGYLVNPNSASATMKIYPPRPSGMAVAIHDSGWTKTNRLSSTNWNYFVMPESVKEALRSDGTPFVVVSDLDIANGVLLNTDGTPKYPILISLAAEAIRDDEVAALANYVTNGGFILVGSSSFTRHTDGTYRGDFALASQMGLSCSPSTNNWVYNYNLCKVRDHRLVNHLPDGPLTWRMPSCSEEISWGSCPDHAFAAAHQMWQVSTNSGVQVLATGDSPSSPYLAVKRYGNGYFIYDAALQPLIGHGGFAPGMYAYVIFRNAIEWAFESNRQPLVRLSPWPYDYEAAFMVRHDLETLTAEVADVNRSAQYELAHGAKGDYYFCTGAITNAANLNAIIAGLNLAASSNGATIGPHNGGNANPYDSCYDPDQYWHWHWGPDEALDLPGGSNYASASILASFVDVETWLTNVQTGPRVWVAPCFNATREASYGIQEQLGVKIAGEQKVTPFPHWTLSTQADGKRYAFLSEPASDWFVRQPAYEAALVAQSLEWWHPPGVHTFVTMHNGVDFYYGLGALINFYSHTLSDHSPGVDPGDAENLTPDNILYTLNTNLHPRVWSANAIGVYQWWLERSAAQVTAAYSTEGSQSTTTITIAGPHTNTAVEVLVPGHAAFHGLVVRTNSGVASTDDYRIKGGVIKVRAAPSVTSVQVQYVPDPTANDDTYVVGADQSSVSPPGVLANDISPSGTTLIATKTGGESGVVLNTNGGFTCPSGAGRYTFTYTVNDGQTNSVPATVNLLVAATNAWCDDFTRAATNANPLAPWVDVMGYRGGWAVANGVLMGASEWNAYAIACNTNGSWTNYSVEARIRFQTGAGGGGVGGRLTMTNGTRYAAWIYPEGSPGGSRMLKLVKFSNWVVWGDGQTDWTPMAEMNLGTEVGTNWHTIRLSFNTNHIDVYCDDMANPKISVDDTKSPPYLNGAVSLEMFNWVAPPAGSSRNMSVDDVIVTPLQ